MRITSDFDGGNIVSVELRPNLAHLEIRKDNAAEFYQWFYFRIDCDDLNAKTFVIGNAGKASFAAGYDTFNACLSYDQKIWVRTETSYDGRKLTINVDPHVKTFWLASFQPYSLAKHVALIKNARQNAAVTHIIAGKTFENRNIDVLKIGRVSPGKKTIWITARQHPGEVMAEWWTEGFLQVLLSPYSSALLENAVIFIVPNMNPDGSARGNLRTNVAGVNLNRVWGQSDPVTSPEVFHIETMMKETGADFILDVHGEEMIPYCFLASGHGLPEFTPRISRLHNRFLANYMLAHPSMQAKYGYPVPEPEQIEMGILTYWAIAEFGCLAETLEMPFGRDATHPDKPNGWTADCARALGAAALPALLIIIPDL